MADLKLTWDDLLIQNRSNTEYADWLKPWHGLIGGRLAPLALNRFGCWFFHRPDGSVEMFDVMYGESERVASTHSEFTSHINNQAWQETYLLSESIYALHQAGHVAADRLCYAIAPPPMIGGPDPWGTALIPINACVVMDVAVWQSLCSQLFKHPEKGTGEPGNA